MIGWLTKEGRAFGRLARLLRITEANLAADEARIEKLEREAGDAAIRMLEYQDTIKGLEERHEKGEGHAEQV